MWLSARFALRELRSGLRGFWVFLACLALGVAAIAAAGSTAQAFRAGLAAQAREIAGGDITVTLAQRQFTAAELAKLSQFGAVSVAARVEAMGEGAAAQRHLVELRGVSPAWPLTGKVGLQGGSSLAAALASVDNVPGAAVEPGVLQRLGIKLGDRFAVGQQTFVARAILLSQPDELAGGFALGPRVLAPLAAVQGGGFLDGSIPFNVTARIALPPGASLTVAKLGLAKALSHSGPGGWRLRDRTNAAPGLERLIASLEYFLGFIGMASLVAGGLGVQGAVSAHLEARRPSIAILKALGATGALTRNIYLIQISLLAVLGVAIGVAIGADIPLLLGRVVRDSLPIPALFTFYPAPLLRAAAFGLLAASAFSLAPLARARTTSPAALLRNQLTVRPGFGLELVLAGLCALALAGLAVVVAPSPLAALILIAGVAAAFGLLMALGWSAAWLAGRARAAARGPLRIGLANLSGPGSAAMTATPAIGLGVALLAAVVLIQSSLLAQVTRSAPKSAPQLVFIGVPGDRTAAFDAAVAGAFGRQLKAGDYLRAPFFTGRIVAVRGEPVERMRIDPSARWAYDHDMGMTALAAPPPNAGVVSGRWWPADYAGPPLVALSVDAARGAKVRLGDSLTLDILGRQIEAKVAVLRKVDVAAFGAAFPVTVDPAVIAGAPVKNMAVARASPAQEARVTAALAKDFPRVDVISVREALATAASLFDRLALAVRAAAAVAALAGLLVLAGAIAARARARRREAAVLKVLGATRGQILLAYAVEYGAVGLIAGVAGVGLGCAAAWPIVVRVFEASWSLDWGGVAALVLGAGGLATLGGVLAALAALAQPPAPALREP